MHRIIHGYGWRLLAVIIAVFYLSACSSTTKLQSLGVHSAAETTPMPIKQNQIYRVVFKDGSTQDAVGTALIMEKNSVCLYYGDQEKWIRYPLSDIEDVYLVNVDQMKKKNRTILITGAAVLAAFAAATAGGYYLEQKLK